MLIFQLTARCAVINSIDQETTMIEMLESLAMVVILVPVMVAVLLGAIYGLGELFNLISNAGKKKEKSAPAAAVQAKPATEARVKPTAANAEA